MRVAPIGMGMAGLSGLIYLLLRRVPLEKALDDVIEILKKQPRHEETSEAIRKAVELASQRPGCAEAIREFGEGWTGEEVLAIGIYCALSAKSYESGVILAVNHDGDSDSTGSIAGNILGAVHGVE